MIPSWRRVWFGIRQVTTTATTTFSLHNLNHHPYHRPSSPTAATSTTINLNQTLNSHNSNRHQYRQQHLPLLPLFNMPNPQNQPTTTASSPTDGRRVIHSNHSGSPAHRGIIGNRISNTKYTPWTFLPKNLWEQFRYTLINIIQNEFT